MSPMRSCSCLRIMSVSEGRPAGSRRVDSEALQQTVAAATPRLQPDLVQAQDVLVGVGIRGLADVVQGIHQRLKFLRQLGEDVAEDARPAARKCLGERPIRAAAHRDVIVDIDQLAGKALREESSHEQRDISEALQPAVPMLSGGRLERLRKHHDERLEAGAFRGCFIKRFGARKRSEQIDHVVLGLILNFNLLLLERAVQLILEVFPQVGDRHYTCRAVTLIHDWQRLLTLSGPSLLIERYPASKVHPAWPEDSVIRYSNLLKRSYPEVGFMTRSNSPALAAAGVHC